MNKWYNQTADTLVILAQRLYSSEANIYRTLPGTKRRQMSSTSQRTKFLNDAHILPTLEYYISFNEKRTEIINGQKRVETFKYSRTCTRKDSCSIACISMVRDWNVATRRIAWIYGRSKWLRASFFLLFFYSFFSCFLSVLASALVQPGAEYTPFFECLDTCMWKVLEKLKSVKLTIV